MTTFLSLPVRVWLLALACAGAFALLWWFTLGHRRWQRRRTLQRRLAELGSAADAAAATTTAPPPRAGPSAHRPRLLFIGDALANIPGLFGDDGDSAAPDAPWRSWALPTMTAIAIHPEIVLRHASDPQWRAAWLRCLVALVDERPAAPLDGIVVCVDAGTLPDAPPALGPLVREAMTLLQLPLPVYLVVCGMERLEGHALACAALPPEVLEQAVGHGLTDRDAANALAVGTSAALRLAALYAPLALRLEALGAALALGSTDPATRLAVHRWVEQVIDLQPRLEAVVTQLFDGPAGAAWRGLYLTGAATSQGPGAFTADLLRRILPNGAPISGGRSGSAAHRT